MNPEGEGEGGGWLAGGLVRGDKKCPLPLPGIRLDCAFCSDISSKADRGRITPLIHKLLPS